MKQQRLVMCEVCGNEIDVIVAQCPFCGAQRKPFGVEKESALFRIVNLEKGKPPVDDALTRMHNEIIASGLNNERVLVLIHGYGSSGRGGTIRKEVRRRLQFMFDRKEINDFLPGEKGDRRSGHFRQLLRRFPFIADLIKKPNPGITLVVL